MVFFLHLGFHGFHLPCFAFALFCLVVNLADSNKLTIHVFTRSEHAFPPSLSKTITRAAAASGNTRHHLCRCASLHETLGRAHTALPSGPPAKMPGCPLEVEVPFARLALRSFLTGLFSISFRGSRQGGLVGTFLFEPAFGQLSVNFRGGFRSKILRITEKLFQSKGS